MADNRTEKATPKRREDARKKGQVARRPELAAIAGFLAALLMMSFAGGQILDRAKHLFAFTMAHAGEAKTIDAPGAHQLLINALLDLAALSFPVILAALTAGLAVNFAQGGLTLSAETLKPKAERFNPLANFKRAFGGNSLVELLKGLLKLGGITVVCYGLFTRAVNDATAMVGASASKTLASVGQLAYELAMRAGGVLALVALLDYIYGRYKHAKSLRMTKQEIKDEYKQQEGDPLVKGQRRRAARAFSQRRIALEVPRADVVVTNPTHFAIALRYDREKDAAPTVVAKGADFAAKRIREIAQAHDVTIVENPPLARTLYCTVEIGQIIPPNLFRAVAELLAYVYRLRERAAS
jgi:flagellar biosynthesis protein FlhB